MRRLLGSDSRAPVGAGGLPAGGWLPEHDHGPSHVALFPTTVGSDCTTTAPTTTCALEPRPTSASAIVSIPNPGPDHAELVVVAASPEFA